MLQLSWPRGLRAWLILGSIVAIGSGLVFGLVIGLVVEFTFALVGWYALSLAGGMASRSVPNEGIRRAAQIALGAGLLVGLVVGLSTGLVVGHVFGPVFGGIGGLAMGLASGLVAGLDVNGAACLQHLVLRYLLVRSNLAPWKYVTFLDYATDRIFLRKIRGGYIFVHRLLLEWFAQRALELGISNCEFEDSDRDHWQGRGS
jgi:hypothetical protein